MRVNTFSVSVSVLWAAVVTACVWGKPTPALAQEVDLTKTAVVLRSKAPVQAEVTAAAMLREEIEKRTGLEWPLVKKAPSDGPAILIGRGANAKEGPLSRAEGYRIRIENGDGPDARVFVDGVDGRGVLFGTGHLLRLIAWEPGRASLAKDLDIATAPAYPIRGHQLGYRHTANSYDAWTPAQYEQYIRELVIFGTNAVENIPFQDSDSPVMPVARDEMNIRMSEICDRYDVDYWVWTPAVFPLSDTAQRQKEIEKHEAFYKACPRLNGVFFPGGDPGDNPPELVMPFLEELSKRLAKTHPKAGVWISLQGFDASRVNTFFEYVTQKKPKWLAGVVAGPQSPPLNEIRLRLPKEYPLRDYPDITHTVLCQYPVPWWDEAFALTLGREPVNPRPRFYARVIEWSAPSTDGFITYSDGVHDDLNKIVWSQRGWSPEKDVRDILVEYCRFFFGPQLAEDAADGLFALESNWDGPLAQNGAVDAVYGKWMEMAGQAPQLDSNWRWRMYLFRIAYDYYTRHRLLYETELEEEVNAVLAESAKTGSCKTCADKAIEQASAILGKADSERCLPEVRQRIEKDAADLFRLIGLQTSVEKYHARNFERGAVLDAVDRPLNNRWWLEDEFAQVRKLASEKEKVDRLEQIARWEDPGPGGFYDDVGNVAKSPRVVRGTSWTTDPSYEHTPIPSFGTWADGGRSRLRLSWLCSMDWPEGIAYEGLDPDGEYVLRVTGRGDAIPSVNGERLTPTKYGKAPSDIKEFPVPKALVSKGKAVVTWMPPDEPGINWRQSSMLTEVWLVKK